MDQEARNRFSDLVPRGRTTSRELIRMETSFASPAAACYSQTSTFQKEDGMQLIQLLSYREEEGRILDLGCGTGYLANALAEMVGPKGVVVAVDPDPKRIDKAIESYGGKPSRSNLTFLVATDKDYPNGDKPYDIVFCNYVLHWIENKERVFKRVFESLKPGGRFGFIVQENSAYPVMFTEVLQVFDPQIVDATIGTLYYEPADFYKRIAANIGFEVTYMEIKDRSFTFPDIDASIDFLYGVFQGKFDRSSPLLGEVRKTYEGRQPVMELQRLTAIFKKPE